MSGEGTGDVAVSRDAALEGDATVQRAEAEAVLRACANADRLPPVWGQSRPSVFSLDV